MRRIPWHFQIGSIRSLQLRISTSGPDKSLCALTVRCRLHGRPAEIMLCVNELICVNFRTGPMPDGRSLITAILQLVRRGDLFSAADDGFNAIHAVHVSDQRLSPSLGGCTDHRRPILQTDMRGSQQNFNARAQTADIVCRSGPCTSWAELSGFPHTAGRRAECAVSRSDLRPLTTTGGSGAMLGIHLRCRIPHAPLPTGMGAMMLRE